MIRNAKFADIPEIVKLLVRAHKASPFRDRCQIFESRASGHLYDLFGGLDRISEDGTFAMVSEHDGHIKGVLIAKLQLFYGITDVLEATDVHWYCEPDAPAGDGKDMLIRMHEWAENIPSCIGIVQATSNFWVNDEATNRLLESMGLKRMGSIFWKDIEA